MPITRAHAKKKDGRGIKNVGNICWLSATIQLFKLVLIPLRNVLLELEAEVFGPIYTIYDTNNMNEKGMIAFQMNMILGLRKCELFDAADFASQLCGKIMNLNNNLPHSQFIETFNIIDKKAISSENEKKQRLSIFIQENRIKTTFLILNIPKSRGQFKIRINLEETIETDYGVKYRLVGFLLWGGAHWWTIMFEKSGFMEINDCHVRPVKKSQARKDALAKARVFLYQIENTS